MKSSLVLKMSFSYIRPFQNYNNILQRPFQVLSQCSILYENGVEQMNAAFARERIMQLHLQKDKADLELTLTNIKRLLRK